MQCISSLLFGVSASLDSLLVGVSYGIRGVHIKLWQNILIGLVTLLGTCLSVGAGHLLTPFLPEALCNYTGSLILALLGVFYIAKWLITLCSRKGAENSDMVSASAAEKPSALSLAEVLALSVTLSLNNLGIGLSASLAGLALLPAAAVTFVSSVVLLFLGNKLGRCSLLQLAGSAADPVSGLLLIGLAVLQFIR